jgi:hypothetical protein
MMLKKHLGLNSEDRTLQVSSNPAVTSLTLVRPYKLRENKTILLFRVASLTALDSLSFAWTACMVTITCPTQARPSGCWAWRSAPLAESPAELKPNPSGWDWSESKVLAVNGR